MGLGTASITLTTNLPVGDTVAEARSRGAPFMFTLIPQARRPGAASEVVHVETPTGPVGASWDGNRLTLRTAPGELATDSLLHLAYMRLEVELHRRGYVTLHAAAASRDGAALLLLGSAGAGKTTTLLRLCRDYGTAMVGNDLVVVGGQDRIARVLTGSSHLRLRLASVARVLPDLLDLFPGDIADSWRAKREVEPAQLGIRISERPASIAAAVFIHIDPQYRAVVDEPGDTLVHRLNLHENAVRYIRGASTPWLCPDGRFGPYVPSLDDGHAHRARIATLERLLRRSRYIAGPPAAVAGHLSAILAAHTQKPEAADFERTP
jgi:hypothetical protein